MPGQGKYIYCIAEGTGAGGFGAPGIGGCGGQLTTIPYLDIAAVVSDSPVRRYPVSRENALAHQRATEAVFQRHTVLPVRFGTVAEGEAAVQAVLEREYETFRALLEAMRGRVEAGLKAVFDEAIYQVILERHDAVRRKKEAIAALPAQQVHWQLVEIGRMVEDALKAEKARVRQEIVQALDGFCCDFRLTDRLLGERMIVNAAFLIDGNQEAAFERQIEALGQRYGEMVRFKYVRGFPPFNFVNLIIEV